MICFIEKKGEKRGYGYQILGQIYELNLKKGAKVGPSVVRDAIFH